jgi:hypothetical protein
MIATKKMFLLIIFSIVATFANAQANEPVTWTFSLKKVNSAEAILRVTCRIAPNWCIYATDLPDGGPIRTSIRLAASEHYRAVGDIVQIPLPRKKFEKAFGMQLSYHRDSVVFEQNIHFSGKPATIKGTVDYMCENGRLCLKPEVVTFELNAFEVKKR